MSMDAQARRRQLEEIDRQIGGLGREICRLHDEGAELTRIDTEVSFLETVLRRRNLIRCEMKREQKNRRIDLDALA